MAEQKRTPGPWAIAATRSLNEGSPTYETEEVDVVAPQVFDHLSPMVIASVQECWQPWSVHANARLIAAAPDLVLVVDKLLSFALGLGYSAVDEFQVMTEEARSAIAKARGE